MRLLLIEDDIALCDSMKFWLEREGFTIDVCHDGEEGIYLIRQRVHDLVLLDRMLPGMDGMQVLSRMRREGIAVPAILVTALGELGDRVEGLNCGADDYIVKPFALEEMTARIRSALRRSYGYEQEEFVSFEDLKLDVSQKKLFCRERSLSLSKREGDLLELFLRNPGQTLPRFAILSRIWGMDAEVEDGNLDNYIYFLRRRLRTVESRVSIKTIRGIGYCLEV